MLQESYSYRVGWWKFVLSMQNFSLDIIKYAFHVQISAICYYYILIFVQFCSTTKISIINEGLRTRGEGPGTHRLRMCKIISKTVYYSLLCDYLNKCTGNGVSVFDVPCPVDLNSLCSLHVFVGQMRVDLKYLTKYYTV